ncbi:MAG: hypothetical protein ACNA7X_00335 [Dehalococcoidia bacterium]
MKRILCTLFALALVLSLGVTTAPPSAAADSGYSFELGTAIINVPGDYETIQEAVDAAVPGNIIVVAAGEYDGFQVLGKQNISIVSTAGAKVTSANVTSINRGPIEDALSMAAVKDSQDIIISGIGFNGAALTEGDAVVGIAYVNSTGRVVNLTVENTVGAQLGAGVAIIGDAGASRVDLLGVTVENSMAGVIVWDAEADLDGCTITGMKPNGGFGIIAAGAGIVIGIPGEQWSGPSNVKVKGSKVSDNNSVGIYVCDGSVLEAHFNRIFGNTLFGVVNDGAEVVDARHNWWGTAAGPFHPTLNPAGVGNNAVSDGVTFEDWTMSEVVTQILTKDGRVDALAQADTAVHVKLKSSSVSFDYAANTADLGDWQIITTVAVTDYPGNPADADPSGFISLHSWIDVNVSNPEVVEEVEIRLYYKEDAISDIPQILGQRLQLMWLDGKEWRQFSAQDRGVSSTDLDGYSGYMWVKLTATTTPDLTYLRGGEFGGYGGPTEIGGICGGGLSSAIPVGLLCIVCCYLSLRNRYGRRDRHAAGGQ